jgi:hypothetical protein
MRFTLVIILIFTIGCQQNSNKGGSKTGNATQKDNTIKSIDTIKSLALPIKIDLYKNYENSLINQNLQIVNGKLRKGFDVYGKLFTKKDRIGVLTTDSNNFTWISIYDKFGKLVSKTALNSKIQLGKDRCLVDEYLIITEDLDIISGYTKREVAIDSASNILALLNSYGYISRFKIDSIGNIKDKN